MQGSSESRSTHVSVPVSRLVAKLKQRTRVPILVPDHIPNVNQTLYISAEAAPTGYYLSLDYIPNCQGATAGNYAEIAAQRGQPLTDPSDTLPGDTIEPIALANGLQGQFIDFCGACCTASIEWQFQGVSYSVAMKNGEKEDVAALANATILAGDRTDKPN